MWMMFTKRFIAGQIPMIWCGCWEKVDSMFIFYFEIMKRCDFLCGLSGGTLRWHVSFSSFCINNLRWGLLQFLLESHLSLEKSLIAKQTILNQLIELRAVNTESTHTAAKCKLHILSLILQVRLGFVISPPTTWLLVSFSVSTTQDGAGLRLSSEVGRGLRASAELPVITADAECLHSKMGGWGGVGDGGHRDSCFHSVL